MNIKELLVFAARDVLKDRPIQSELFRSNRVLERDEIISRMLDDAQDILANDSHCFVDRDTPEVAVYTLAIDQQVVELSQSVLAVYDRPVVVLTDGSFRYMHRTKPRILHTHTGTIPNCFTIRRNVGQQLNMHLVPAVGEAGLLLRLEVARKALVRFTAPVDETETAREERLNSQCELPIEFHERLTDYVLMRATTRRDVDKEAKRDSQLAEKRWRQTMLDLRADTYRLVTTDDHVYNNPQC